MRMLAAATLMALVVPASAQIKTGTLPRFDARLSAPTRLPEATLPSERVQIFMKLAGDAVPKVASATRRVSVVRLIDNGAWLKLVGVQASGDPSGKLADGYAYIFAGDKPSHQVELTIPKSSQPMLVDCGIGTSNDLESEIISGLSRVGGGPVPKGNHAYLATPPSPTEDVVVRLFSPTAQDWHFFNCEITAMG